MRMRRLFFVFVFVFSTSAFAEDVFVSYLKPVGEKNAASVIKTKRRDPMAEPLALQPVFKQKNDLLIEKLFELKAILYNPKSKKAFINNELYMEGDDIDGYKVKSITVDTVVLSKDGKDFVLKIE